MNTEKQIKHLKQELNNPTCENVDDCKKELEKLETRLEKLLMNLKS